MAIDTDSCARHLGQRDDQIAKHRQRRGARGRESARSSRPRTIRAHSELADSAGCSPAASSGRSSSRRRPAICLDRLHDALADAARRHVDHAPQADVVVRIDDQAHVGERVLDFLPLVEPDAADDLVGDALRASARLQSSATARWCDTAPRPSPRRRRPARVRAVRVMKSASSSSSPPRK